MTSLELFLKKNPSVESIEETEHINLKRLWNDETFMCRFDLDTDFSALKDVELPHELTAVFHIESQMLEFIFAPLSNDLPFLNRKTKFLYKGITFETEFSAPTQAIELLAKGFRKLDTPGDSSYRNLETFSDFYKLEEQSETVKKYFKDKVPYSYKIQGDFKTIKKDFINFSKHLNVYLRFFDRKAPIIHITLIEPATDTFKLPCHTTENDFPEIINTSEIDPVALDLLNIAQETGYARLKYLFYYQVLEYFAYYYLDEELKRKLHNILRSPDILSNPIYYTRNIIEELKDYSNNTSDKQKLTKLIFDYINIEDVILEIKSNIKVFTNDLEFDGNFKLQALIGDEKILDKISLQGKESKSKKQERQKLRQDIISNIVDRIENIRNVLVHIRETRENKVILPTRGNNRRLIPYIYLIRRIAEHISIKYQG